MKTKKIQNGKLLPNVFFICTLKQDYRYTTLELIMNFMQSRTCYRNYFLRPHKRQLSIYLLFRHRSTQKTQFQHLFLESILNWLLWEKSSHISIITKIDLETSLYLFEVNIRHIIFSSWKKTTKTICQNRHIFLKLSRWSSVRNLSVWSKYWNLKRIGFLLIKYSFKL